MVLPCSAPDYSSGSGTLSDQRKQLLMKRGLDVDREACIVCIPLNVTVVPAFPVLYRYYTL